jgi:hypothetical protein
LSDSQSFIQFQNDKNKSIQHFISLMPSAVQVICREEQFYLDVPQAVRALGPWSVIGRGDVGELAAEHRLTLARQGYVVIEAHMLGLKKA